MRRHWRAAEPPKAQRHEALHAKLLAWRWATAQKLRLAPADVLSESTCVALCPGWLKL